MAIYSWKMENILIPDMMPSSTSGTDSTSSNQPFQPIQNHWFYKQEIENRTLWEPFTRKDSGHLEAAFLAGAKGKDAVVATDGGRYDVNIPTRTRTAAYWSHPPSTVRRCSWFFKGNVDGRFVPYEEEISTKLEDEYKIAYSLNQWHHRVQLSAAESVVFHGPDVLVHFSLAQSPDVWGNTPQTGTRPRVVKRGLEDFDIEDGESSNIDHLLFMVHGVGSGCDLKFRSVEVVVDEFRSICQQLVQSHYYSSCQNGTASRIEVLPISWHEKLHSEDTGIDRKLKSITLESIPRLRDFTNDTLLDILFYTSPIYCQTIISTVGNELNRIFDLFKKRNPGFTGGVSLGGHSLGSLILFDILCHQKSADMELNEDSDGMDTPLMSKPHPLHRRMSKRISYMMSVVGTGQPQLNYPHLHFHPNAFFALGSPIGMFVTIRGLDTLGDQFALPTCPSFFNIFHPYDPVAYRIESLVNPELATLRPVLIPHHKGRKRMHLELKETMVRVGADLKQRFFDSVRTTWNSLYQFTMNQKEIDEVDKMLDHPLDRQSSMNSESDPEIDTNICLGVLNQGRRIDYVLQEAPVEFFNEYLFALQSHVCYWESEDTMLIILKEIYESMGIRTDSQVPQQTMTIRPSELENL